jgi:hypothetical protein
MDERLPHLVGGLIVEVFGSKSRRINGRVARITFGDHMLLNELHDRLPWLEAVPRGAPFSVWLGVVAFCRAQIE